MPKFILLFRGINVGGKNKLPMQGLREILAKFEFENVQTYIQSGNVVVNAPAKIGHNSIAKISAAIEKKFNFSPAIFVLSATKLKKAIRQNPFPQAVDEPKSLHVLFLAAKVKNQVHSATEKVLAPTESFEILGDVLYFHAPDGIGRSKFAARADRILGVETTGRNWRTILKLQEMVDA